MTNPIEVAAPIVIELELETLDAGNVRRFKASLEPAMQPGARLIFDMSRTRFVDSSGLGAILSCLRQLHATNGELKLC